MSCILAIDYGKVRTGLAITDPLQIIASPLDTVSTSQLFLYLEQLFLTEKVEKLVVGLPMRAHGVAGEIEVDIQKFLKAFKKKYPKIEIYREDESYTSLRAAEALVLGGVKKKKRQKKGMLDKISATLILQSFMKNQK
ncbi:Putative Holliday junction resolvase [Candidatus Ornithobacterium hominis]|uniref:Putative pre-16S rRNA nuclease n=1 Tax=Candidatus Ornithobacterium hominis TaxID=2497989 RepID=A0A383U3I5_9FLAO|nr:Holliday junction resolvase RuvX [Candidatus Ornithobacterium hominis]MCT7905088.1 Holliday junction resolvase RuvX [Candidatus Ornithobacterium hominis]SZD73513.1 Putative Holliday junction resolvase [Candidatus Ornithobacterium hominis]